MCRNREHRYRVHYTIGETRQDVVVYAKGIAEAIAKADGFVSAHYPGHACTFEVSRVGYGSPSEGDIAGAQEHGVIFPESFELSWRDLAVRHPKAFAALPSPYQSDSCLMFRFSKEGNLNALPKEDQKQVLGDWVSTFKGGKWKV